MKYLVLFISVFVAWLSWKAFDEVEGESTKFYKLSWQESAGKWHNMTEYKDKVVIIFNSGSQCGFAPQLRGMETLYRRYKSKGLQVIGFPSGQFNTELQTDQAILAYTRTAYNVTYPMAKQCLMQGDDMHPIFAHLKEYKAGLAGVRTIQWNFVKFIVDRTGKARYRFDPPDKPEQMEDAVKDLIAEDSKTLVKQRYIEQLKPQTIWRNIQAKIRKQYAAARLQVAYGALWLLNRLNGAVPDIPSSAPGVKKTKPSEVKKVVSAVKKSQTTVETKKAKYGRETKKSKK
jgi:glutathione peroxidase